MFFALFRYMKNSYHFERGLTKLSDGRINPTYSTSQVIMILPFYFLLRKKVLKNSIFNNLKRECGLDHCFVHGENTVEKVLYLIFMALNIMQIFLVRRLRDHFTTQREIVRLLLKGLYLLKYRSEFIFSSL